MRVTVSHTKSKQQMIRDIDRSFDDLFRGIGAIPIKFVSERRSWQGSTLTFSLAAKMGLLSAPIKGTIEVTDRDLTIDLDLVIPTQCVCLHNEGFISSVHIPQRIRALNPNSKGNRHRRDGRDLYGFNVTGSPSQNHQRPVIVGPESSEGFDGSNRYFCDGRKWDCANDLLETALESANSFL